MQSTDVVGMKVRDQDRIDPVRIHSERVENHIGMLASRKRRRQQPAQCDFGKSRSRCSIRRSIADIDQMHAVDRMLDSNEHGIEADRTSVDAPRQSPRLSTPARRQKVDSRQMAPRFRIEIAHCGCRLG